MDSVEMHDFLMSATANNDSILAETDRIFDKTTDQNNSNSLYYSIVDDTLSNRLAEDLQEMERTLTDLVAETAESSHKSTSSVIQNNTNNNNLDLLATTIREEDFFKQNMPAKLFPLHPMRSQCSTPKLEVVAPHKTLNGIGPGPLKLDASLALPEHVMPLTTIMQKIEDKKKKTVTIVERAENKENIQEASEEQQQAVETKRGPAKQVKIAAPPPSRKSLKPAAPGILAKTNVPRKSMIPNAPTTSAATATAIGKATDNKAHSTGATSTASAPALPPSRKSVRMSVVPTTFKSSRFTIGRRSGKLNSPSTLKMSPKTIRMGPVKAKALPSRMTMTAASAEVEEKKPKMDEEKVKKRLSRIPPPESTASTATSAQPRAAFSCTICKSSFHLKSTLLMHRKIHEQASVEPTGHFKCKYCDKAFEKELGLSNHVDRYCTMVPAGEKRKRNGGHNRTRTASADIKDRSKREQSSNSSSSMSSSSRLEATSSSASTSGQQSQHQTSTFLFGGPPVAKKKATTPAHTPASGVWSLKPIKSISQPHSGIKMPVNKPVNCYLCRLKFKNAADFHKHVEEMHPPPVESPDVSVAAAKDGGVVCVVQGKQDEQK